MMWRLVALALFLAGPVGAEPIRVTSGQHADFSRLVIALPTPQNWTLGRTETGYELALEGEDARFDLSKVFDLIPKDRLTGIYTDPVSNRLQLTVGCTCHALPFSLDAQTIVIDLRDGPAPAQSSFEAGLDGTLWPALQTGKEAGVRPRFRQQDPAPVPRYDWLTASLAEPELPVAFPMPAVPDQGNAIREALFSQLARGAARDVIQLALPERPDVQPDVPTVPTDIPIRVAGEIGLQIGTPRPDPQALQPDGAACISDDDLDLAGWLPEEAAAAPYSGLSAELVGEFDRPQETKVIASAKRLLYLGFGAEARALLRAFPVETTAGQTLTDLSYLIDGEPLPAKNAFTGMADCDTAAALWALLSSGVQTLSEGDHAGLKRAFSALPPHLRTHLGPKVVETLLDDNKTALAVEIRQIMERAGAVDQRAIALVSSEVLLNQGEADLAVSEAKEVMADPGQLKAEAILSLVRAQIAAEEVVAPETVETLAALLDEYAGHPLHADLVEIYGVALAGAGQFAEARAFAEQGHPLTPAFWQRLAMIGTDDDVLVQAIPPEPRRASAEAADQIADRLDGLGFPREAALWRGAQDDMTTAQAGDATPDRTSPSQQPSTSEALVPDSASPEPVETVLPTGDVTTAVRAARWNRDWPSVAKEDQGPWRTLAAGLIDPDPADQPLSLANATAVLAQSRDARALIDGLLQETTGNPPGP